MGLRQPFDEGHLQDVYHFIYRHVGNREEAEELTEQTFMQAARAQSNTAGPPSAQSTQMSLRRAAHKVVAAYLGQAYLCSLAAPSSELGDESGDELDCEPTDAATTAQRIFARLPARDSELLTYRLLHNYSLAETANRMGLSMKEALALQWSALTRATQVAAREEDDEAARCPVPCAAGDGAQ
jgi:DNA-directed RNA polymerase specialized sigma24 family protein